MNTNKAVLFFILFVSSASIQAMTSSEIKQQLITESLKQGLDPALALAIAKVESDFNADAVSHAGAVGVMQIMPATAEQEFGVSRYRLKHPQTNIRLGITFIKQLLASYNNRLDIALSHYNGGSAVRTKSGGLRVIPATQSYVNKVMGHKSRFAAQFDLHDSGSQAINTFARAATLTQARQISADNSLVAKITQLRMHNMLRNSPKPAGSQAKSRRNQVPQQNQNSKLAKVRQWESIF
ncbi:MAG: hypothetical protein ACJA13_001076 [Paraglaciecola sp.]|jgi:hypothetical protein